MSKQLKLSILWLALCIIPTISATAGDPGLQIQLIESIRNEDLQTVRKLVQEGSDLEYYDQIVSTPLVEATSTGNIEIVKFLMNSGAMLDNTLGGQTALMVAARRKDLQMVRLLISAGADVNAESSLHHGEALTPLFAALLTQNPSASVVQELIRAGGTRNKVALLNALRLARAKGLHDIENMLAKPAGKLEVVFLSYEWKSIKGVKVGFIAAVVGLLIWPILYFSRRSNKSVRKIIRRIFWTQLFLHTSFLVFTVTYRLLMGWTLSLPIIGTLFFSYYFAFVAVLGIVSSLLVLLLTSGHSMNAKAMQDSTGF